MPLKTQSDEQPSLNLTPMIDIVFLLIIFFMVGTKFTELSDAEHELDIDVPEVGVAAAMTPAPSKRVVRIHENGAIEFDQQPVTLGELVEKLTEAQTQYPKLGVIVRGDRKPICKMRRPCTVPVLRRESQTLVWRSGNRPNGDKP